MAIASIETLFSQALEVPQDEMENFCRNLTREEAAELYHYAGKREEEPHIAKQVWWILLSTKARRDNHIN